MTKLSYEFVKESFKTKGYTLISTEYINTKSLLIYLCNNGVRHSITWQHFSAGRSCNCNAKNKQLTYDFVSDSFKEDNYKLLSTVYNNNYTKLLYICPKGHEHSIIWANWNKGHRCPTCAGQTKPTIEKVRESFICEGYTLLSTKYINAYTHLHYICNNGHKHSMMWTNWQQGYRCPTCYSIYNNGPNTTNWRGGISFEPYCEAWKDNEYKKDIRERDGNKCLNPYCNSKDVNDLTIHHIDYDKKNCSPKNLITVCRSCNSKANTDRDWHQSWYQTLLCNRYNYRYLKEKIL